MTSTHCMDTDVHTAWTLMYTLHGRCCGLQCIHFLSLHPFSPMNAAHGLAELWLFALWLILDLFKVLHKRDIVLLGCELALLWMNL